MLPTFRGIVVNLQMNKFAHLVCISRMEPINHLCQMSPVEVHVDFGRGDAFVAEHLLDRTQIGSVFEKMRRE